MLFYGTTLPRFGYLGSYVCIYTLGRGPRTTEQQAFPTPPRTATRPSQLRSITGGSQYMTIEMLNYEHTLRVTCMLLLYQQ